MNGELKIKTFWKERSSNIWSFYCPCCRSPRRVPFRPKPGGFRHYSQVAITAAFFTAVCWPTFGIKGVISFVPFWIIFEAVYRGRVRALLACSQCGFDPFLYMTDVGRARDEIRTFWRGKFAEKGVPFPGDPAPVAAPETITESAQPQAENAP